MASRLRPVLAGLSALVLASAASVAFAQDKVTIRLADLFGGENASAQVYGKSIADWQAKHPDVNLVRELSVGDDQRTKLATDLAANNMADVFFDWTGPGQMNKFVDAGVALDMNEFFKVAKKLKPEHWTPAQLDAGRGADGVLYQLPRSAFKCFTLYNTALFDKYKVKPPTSWDELVSVSKVFNDNGIVPIDMGSKGGNPAHLFYNAILDELPNGLKDVNAVPDSHNVSTDSMKAAAKIVLDMRNNKIIPQDSVANGDWPPSIVLYNQQKAAMVYTCPWMLQQIDPGVAKTTELMYFPDMPGATRPGKSFNVGTVNDAWMINKASWEDPKKQEAIRSLVEDALLTPDVEHQVVEQGSFPAWNTTPEEVAALKLTPLTAKVISFTATSPDLDKPLVNNMPTAGSLNAYLETMDKLFAGQDPVQTLTDFQTTVNRETE